jgi:single-strand DNA-binding protein
MASLNKVMIIGNLTRDPEVKYTPKGQAIAEISLAVNRSYSTADGEKREEVTYLEVTFWGKQAEVLGQWMKKGRPLYVEGRLRLDSWEDKETGKKQSRLRITGEEFQFLGSKNDGGGGGQYEEGGSSRGSSGGYSQNRPSSGQQRPPQNSEYDDSPPPRNAPSQQPRPDAFPPGLDDDEIPF